MTKKIPISNTELRLTKVIGTIAFFLSINSLLAQTDTARQSYSAYKKISKNNLVILFQDSLYTIYGNIKVLHRKINRYGHPTLDNIYSNMIRSGSKDFYSECVKNKCIVFSHIMTGNLIRKNKTLLVNNLSKKHEDPISYKAYIVIKKGNGHWYYEDYFVKNHLLFNYNYLPK